MSEAIRGEPEGRPGVWLITPEEATKLVKAVQGKEIHNFIGHEAILIGANWPKSDVLKHVQTTGMRIGLLFPPQTHGKHQLVCLTDEKRWSFDVGAIDESRMVDA